jgi:hypothetical protein
VRDRHTDAHSEGAGIEKAADIRHGRSLHLAAERQREFGGRWKSRSVEDQSGPVRGQSATNVALGPSQIQLSVVVL